MLIITFTANARIHHHGNTVSILITETHIIIIPEINLLELVNGYTPIVICTPYGRGMINICSH